MKKKLEADLMSIAHRVLQIKNKSDINQLYIETQKLYEKLSILRFIEEHFSDAKPTIGQAEIVEKMKQFFEEIKIQAPLVTKIPEENVVEAEKLEEIKEEVINTEVLDELPEEVQQVLVEEEIKEEIEEEIEEEVVAETPIKIQETVAEIKVEEEKEETSKNLGFLPAFELDVVVEDETPKKSEEVQISFMDLLGSDYSEPMFVKVDHSEAIPAKITFELPKETNFGFDNEEITASIDVNTKRSEPKSVSLNDKFAKGITIGLNDRIAFVKHLFGNSDEDYNRVMNQLITYDNFEEAQNFIEDMVKPDYNSWVGKEEYAQRFLEIIEKKFA